MQKRIKRVGGRIVGYGSICLFGLILLGLAFPVVGSSSSALDNTTNDAAMRLLVKAVETVSIRLASRVDLALEPHSAGSFGIATTELGITTNDPEGFEVFLAATDSEAALRGVSDQIRTIEASTSGNNFSGNTWGYHISKQLPTIDATYSPISPTSSSILKTTTATVDQEDIYNLDFGVHITPSLPAGEYSTSVVLSVVANPAVISTLSDLVYMQDMDSTICQNTPSAYNHETNTVDRNSDYYLNPITKRLYDLRDGKQYWVAKLADGNCWMTQNLALDLDVNAEGNAVAVSEKGSKVELNQTNTDIAFIWSTEPAWNSLEEWETLGESYTEKNYPIAYAKPRKTEEIIPEESDVDYTDARSWTLENFIEVSNWIGHNCQNVSSTADIGIGTTCTRLRTTPEGYSPSNSPILTNAIDNDAKQYDAHRLMGNYYQWNTATASTGIDLKSISGAGTNPNNYVHAAGSICPKGWKLPTSGRYEKSNDVWPYDWDDSFYRLLYAYGYPETGSSFLNGSGDGAINWISDYGGFTSLTGQNKTEAVNNPMYFTRAGYINPATGLLMINNNPSIYWSDTLTVYNNHAITFHVSGYQIYPTRYTTFNTGASVRCLAR